METGNRLTAARGEGRAGGMMERGEGTRRSPRVNDPQTWTAAWGWTVAVGGGLDGEGQRGKIGTTVIE